MAGVRYTAERGIVASPNKMGERAPAICDRLSFPIPGSKLGAGMGQAEQEWENNGVGRADHRLELVREFSRPILESSRTRNQAVHAVCGGQPRSRQGFFARYEHATMQSLDAHRAMHMF